MMLVVFLAVADENVIFLPRNDAYDEETQDAITSK
jgi:hypothetical protein